ncbi:hypothetical protein [Spirosoma sp.]|uniref:hypothetical protein n=1 Tax=Spirosoma sp. TaxID=1899569 RepID=UPI003B3BCFCC
MNKDLFGNDLEPGSDAAEEEIINFDKKSFGERLRRLRYINTMLPFGTREYGSDESFKIFNEAVHCYIFGQFVATIILCQAFIERRFQEYFHIRMDDKRSKYTLDKLLKEFSQTNFIDDYLIEKINNIRLKRNPFVHSKEPLHEHSLMARALNLNSHPEDVIEADAKEALTMMIAISRMRIL